MQALVSFLKHMQLKAPVDLGHISHVHRMLIVIAETG